jgi:hypothetical protein
MTPAELHGFMKDTNSPLSRQNENILSKLPVQRTVICDIIDSLSFDLSRKPAKSVATSDRRLAASYSVTAPADLLLFLSREISLESSQNEFQLGMFFQVFKGSYFLRKWCH